ncbi:unnamed protein product [Dicrocoelium dendriticum]|nr:unnamed protein product [Dicrocoelium dendriticum]
MWLVNKRVQAYMAVFCVLVVGIIFWEIQTHERPNVYHTDKMTSNVMLELRKLIHKAHRTARSGQTKLLLQQSLNLLREIGIEGSDLVHEDSSVTEYFDLRKSSLPETCPEHWGNGRKEDLHPDNIYYTIPCARIPLEDLVEILLHVDSCSQAKHLIDRVRLIYPKITIHISVENAADNSELCEPSGSAFVYKGRKDEASNWMTLARVGRSNRHTDLDRLLRVMNSLQVDIVGGAVRLEPEGRWYPGCYQSAIRNFSLILRPGHDISAKSCAYCDYVASPFLIRRDVFNRAMKNSKLKGVVSFVELMLSGIFRTGRLELQTVACIDVMFHVAGHHTPRGYGVSEIAKTAWLPLAKQWSIDRIILSGGVDHRWTCDDVEIDCISFKQPGLIIPRCCLEELFNYIMMFIDAATRFNVSNYIVSGTLMGAVKMNNGILPWEKDADVCWDVYKHATVSGLIANHITSMYDVQFPKQRNTTKHGTDIAGCNKTGAAYCLYHSIRAHNWFVELYGVPVMYSYQPKDMHNVTKVSLNGHWLTGLPNPGRASRHGYGDNILGHIQHWGDYGAPNGWTRYTNVEVEPFLSCPTGVVRHACLSGNYLPLGNIQFQDNPA